MKKLVKTDSQKATKNPAKKKQQIVYYPILVPWEQYKVKAVSLVQEYLQIYKFS